jgi:hypothetical protein
MPILPKEASELKIPEMHRVRQRFSDEKLTDIAGSLKREFESEAVSGKIQPGSRIAMLVGSRGIAGLPETVRATAMLLKECGAEPFIVPAMGSHGGGDAGAQRRIIENYGISEANIGVPIISSMETIVVGETKGGIPVHIDAAAAKADGIVPIARIKPHTDFSGTIESGICKMLAIGLGKHSGCSRLHREGFAEFPNLIPDAASVVMSKRQVPFGVGIVENAYDQVYSVHVVPGGSLLDKEPELLRLSKSLLPRLYFSEIDVLIVEQIGKEISGAGMDPNITGRMPTGPVLDFNGPRIKRIVVLDLSPGTHGNATGLGIADFTLERVLPKMDTGSTYANCIASGTPEAARIPIALADEREAIRAAIQSAAKADPDRPKIARIADTLHLVDISVSEALLDECKANPGKFIVCPETEHEKGERTIP